jgi:branched-chain amino acid aminotransferase
MEHASITASKPSLNLRKALVDTNPGFGKYYGDHMFESTVYSDDWKEDYGKFVAPKIKPFQDLIISPACFGLHYAQTAFEGLLAFIDASGRPTIFRPEKNWQRFNDSLTRIAMPKIKKEDFFSAIEGVVSLDRDWINRENRHSLYIRPFMFCDEAYIGVRESNQRFRFIIITTLNAGYHSGKLELYVPRKAERTDQREYARAVSGGTGAVKASANYPGTLLALSEAKANDCNEVLWIDAFDGNRIEEIGTNNAFFLIKDKIVTPKLSGSILPGVTRESALVLLKDLGYDVEQRAIGLTEIISEFRSGNLKEAFATGTASSVKPIAKINCQEQLIELNISENSVASKLKTTLDNIKWSVSHDQHGWMHKL